MKTEYTGYMDNRLIEGVARAICGHEYHGRPCGEGCDCVAWKDYRQSAQVAIEAYEAITEESSMTHAAAVRVLRNGVEKANPGSKSGRKVEY